MSKEMAERIVARFTEAGCEKLPEGGMRDNCEKKSKGKTDDKGDDKKDDKKPDFLKKKDAGEVPEAFKKEWKNKDKDGDGKENEPKPDFLKKSSTTPKGVVAAMNAEGKVELFAASTPQSATGIKAALMAKGGYTRIASGPNEEGRSIDEMYGDFEQRWAAEENQDEEADEDDDKE